MATKVVGGSSLDVGAGAAGANTLRTIPASDSPGASDMAAAASGIGTATDAAAAVGSTGSLSAKLRTLTSQLGEVQASPTANTVLDRLKAIQTPIGNIGAGEYETVAASQTAQVLGATGAAGDYIAGLLVVPATTSPGNVLLLDGATSITVFAGGASSVSNLVPFFIPLGMVSVSGAWKVTTGADVSVIGIGNFT